MLCRSSQFSTHFTNCIAISALLRGTFAPASGATISDCGPSARLNVYWNSKDYTPRCWQEFFCSEGSNISGLEFNWLAISSFQHRIRFFRYLLSHFAVLHPGRQVFNIEQTRPGVEFRFYFEYEVGRKARGGVHWNASENVIAGSESGWGHLLREQQGECPLISLILRESPSVDLRHLCG